VNPSSKPAVITFVAGLGLLIPAAIGLLPSGVPTVLSPFPALTVIPALLFSDLHLVYVAVMVPMLLFFAWNPQLFRGEARVPKRSYVLLLVASALSLFDFVISWKWGLHYQSAGYTVVVCLVNILWVGFRGFAFARSWKGTSSFRWSVFVHWMLFAWLAWYAFPWLGELI
jgi:hypothetical protein